MPVSSLRTALADAAQWFRGRHKAALDATDAIFAQYETSGYYSWKVGTVTWSGGGATLASTITGAVTTDIVLATIKAKPTQAASLARAVISATNTMTLELSTANTSNDAVIGYMILRPIP